MGVGRDDRRAFVDATMKEVPNPFMVLTSSLSSRYYAPLL